MLLPFLDAREVRICPVVTRQICLPKAAFLLTRLPFGSWMSASDHSWLASPSARAANHTSSRRNTSLCIADTSCYEKISCAPFLLTSGSLNSRITYRRSFGCSLASSSSTTTVPPRSPSDSRTPLATSGRFRRPNRPETLRDTGISPGRLSRQRTTPAENRTEVQGHGEIGAHFLRNRPEVAGARPRAGPQ